MTQDMLISLAPGVSVSVGFFCCIRYVWYIARFLIEDVVKFTDNVCN